MSVPPQILQMMQQQGGQGGQQPQGQPQAAPGAAPPTGVSPGAPPAAAGMPTPQKKAGLIAAAGANIHIAMNMLEQALPVFGSETKQGKGILKVLSMLSAEFGQNMDKELVPSQIMQMARQEPSMGGGSAMQQA